MVIRVMQRACNAVLFGFGVACLKHMAGARQWIGLLLVITLQSIVIPHANAVLRPALTNEEMKALPAADIGRLRWLQQYQSNVMSKKNEDLKTSIANVEKWHDCIKFGVDVLSLGLDIKSGIDLSKSRTRYAEAADYFDQQGWFTQIAATGFKEMGDRQRRRLYWFSFGMAIDLLGTNKLSCFGGDTTAIAATLNATGAQDTAEAMKRVMEDPQYGWLVDSLLTLVIDSLKGVDIDAGVTGFAAQANSPVFLKILRRPFSALKLSPPKWDYFLTKGLQITNDLFFAQVLASDRKEADSNWVAFDFLKTFYGNYKGNLEQFCLEISYGPNCTHGTIEQIFYAYLNTPESNGVTTSSQYNSFTVRDRLILGVDFFDGLNEQTALGRIRNTLLQGPLVVDLKITRIPDGVILNDTNLTNGTKKFTIQSSLNSLVAMDYTPVWSSTDCKLNFGTTAFMDCSTGIDRPGEVDMTFNMSLTKGTQNPIPVQVLLNFPVIASASDMSAPYWTDDAVAALAQSDGGNFKASYTIQAPRFLHNPSGQLYALGAGDTYWAWAQRGETLVTDDIVPPDLSGQIPLEFQVTPEDRATSSQVTVYLAASSKYADALLPEAHKVIPLDSASLAALEGATPYLLIIHPDLLAAAYNSADRSFAVKAGDVLQFLPGNDSRFANFNLFTGSAYVVFICMDSQTSAFCNGAYGTKIQGQLQANGALQITAPADGRIIAPTVFGSGVIGGQASDKIVLEYPWAKLEEQIVASTTGGTGDPTTTITTAPHPLNDTGITTFSNDTQNGLTTEPATHPRQDARYGRDAQAGAGKLTKIGGGGKGFDFSKIANDGSVLPESAVLGSGTKDWACTRDNVTGLIWEVKTTSGLRSQSHTYTWYNSDPASNGGAEGTASGGSCFATGRCDTEKFAADVNAATLCGASDWRMPKVKELEGIADFGRVNPAIDPTYFPNTSSSVFWSGSPSANGSNDAWYVYFNDGRDGDCGRNYVSAVRLVRGGQ